MTLKILRQAGGHEALVGLAVQRDLYQSPKLVAAGSVVARNREGNCGGPSQVSRSMRAKSSQSVSQSVRQSRSGATADAQYINK